MVAILFICILNIFYDGEINTYIQYIHTSKWLEPYVELNTHIGTEAKKDGDRDGKVLYKLMNNAIHILLYLSNLVAKAPGLNIGKKLSNLHSNHEAFN